MSDVFDAIVVGVGAMGASTCYALARRGLRVLGLEQFAVGHDRGSSHGQSRMIRMAYYEHPDYVPLLRRAYELWRQIESEAGRQLLYVTGGLYASPPGGEVVSGSIHAAVQHDLPHEPLSAGAARERFPLFRLPDPWSAVYEPAAGFLLPEDSVLAIAELARQNGAKIIEQSPVKGWSDGPGGTITVHTLDQEYVARRLIVCGGAWSGRLLAGLGVPLRVTRQVMGWVTPEKPDDFALGSFPVWAIENADRSLQYGFPILPGGRALKVSWHGTGAAADPDEVDRTTSGADVATFLTSLPHILPSALGPVAEVRTCLYTNSPDHHFIIDRMPDDPRVTVACGFSGHGFKFASVVGELASDLALDGRSSLPASFLGLGRFKH